MPDVQTVKSAASGWELEVLHNVAGIDAELLDGNHHPCPKCGGHDRFRWMVEREGKPVLCNQCFKEGNGDIIAAVKWMCDCSFPEAVTLVADYLGASPTKCNGLYLTGNQRFHGKVPKQKSETQNPKPDKPKPALLRTIPFEYLNGVGDYHVKIERLEFADGSKSFRQSRWDIEQRRYVSGKGCMEGVGVIPWDAPSFKEASVIYWCEGEKKTVALAKVMEQHRPEICCSCKWGGSGSFPPELVTWFHGKDVVIFADNDESGEKYALRVASAVTETAKSVSIVTFSENTAKYDIADWLDETKGET
jgi:hypothetical protein